MKQDPKTIHHLLQELLRSEPHSFPPERQAIQAPTEQGVYIIYDPKGRAIHVGRSVRGDGGLRQRLKNHLRGNSSFTNNYLGGDGNKLRLGYKFKYLAIPEPRRAVVEALATGTLCPLHLGLGQANQ